MRLAGDLAEFSLPDLIQVKSAGRQTDGLKILGPDGNGTILIRNGDVIHAQYEELEGETAFLALLGVRAGYFEATDVPPASRRTIQKPLRELLIDAHLLAEKGALPRPVRRATLPGVAALGSEIRVAGPASVRPRIGLFSLGIAAALLLGVAAAILLDSRAPEARSPQAASAGASEVVVEADALTGPGDDLPRLRSGEMPLRPDPDAAVVPTVVVRLRIDAGGKVAEAKVYRSRLEFAAFEEAAVAAAERFVFEPAKRAGEPVGVWINWPIEFG
jgi:TonB family protein